MIKKKILTALAVFTVAAVATLQPVHLQQVQAAQSDVLIVIDPGHFAGYNPGCVSGFNEGDWAVRQSSYDAEALRDYGFDVIVTRSAGQNPGLYDRGQIAVRNGRNYSSTVFMSNHTNAYGASGNSSASGVMAYTSPYLSAANTTLLNKLMAAVAGEMNKTTGNTAVQGIRYQLNNDGTDYYGVIRGSLSSARNAQQAAAGPVQYSFILEHGFHTNAKECSYLAKDSNCRALAAVKAKVFAEYFGKLPYVQWTGTVKVASNDTLNMRSQPSSDAGSNVLHQFGNGNRLQIQGEAVNQKYGDLWFRVYIAGLTGYVHSTYIQPDHYIGAASARRWLTVYADHGSSILKGYPNLNTGNRVDVISCETVNGISWCKVHIARKYIGYVKESDIQMD